MTHGRVAHSRPSTGLAVAAALAMDQAARLRRVMLVDDEPRVVEGLKKALYQYRKQWTVETATAAREALDRLSSDFDVIITDVRMPEMDGLALLREVSERWPSMLRVVLSGESGRDGVERAQALSHHFIPKPVRAPALFARVEESLSARDRLAEPGLRDLVYRLGTLPALPGTFARINQLAESETSKLEQFVDVIEQDPAVCGNVLRSVNSAWFGLSRRVASLKEAVGLLGVRPLRSLVLATELFAGAGVQVEHLRQRALARLAAVPKLCALLGVPHLRDEGSTAAVLADVGQLLLALRLPEESAGLVTLFGASRVAAEQRLFGADHALVGAVLLKLWNLPANLVDAVALHHTPTIEGAEANLTTFLALTCRLQELSATAPSDDAGQDISRLASLFGAADLEALSACFAG